MFCPDEQVTFIPTDQVNKTCLSTDILASSQRLLLVYIKGIWRSKILGLLSMAVKISVLAMKLSSCPYLKSALGWWIWPFEASHKSRKFWIKKMEKNISKTFLTNLIVFVEVNRWKGVTFALQFPNIFLAGFDSETLGLIPGKNMPFHERINSFYRVKKVSIKERWQKVPKNWNKSCCFCITAPTTTVTVGYHIPL